MTYRQDLWQIAAQWHGIVTTRQADDAGVPGVEVRKLAARGALNRVGHGVYRHMGVPVDEWTELAAAVAQAGEDAYLEGETVLAMFDLALVNPPQVRVGTPHRRRGKATPQTAVTHRNDLADDDLTTYHGIPSVTVRRALLDCIPHLLGERVIDAVAAAKKQDLIDELEAVEITGAVARRKRQMVLAS